MDRKKSRKESRNLLHPSGSSLVSGCRHIRNSPRWTCFAESGGISWKRRRTSYAELCQSGSRAVLQPGACTGQSDDWFERWNNVAGPSTSQGDMAQPVSIGALRARLPAGLQQTCLWSAAASGKSNASSDTSNCVRLTASIHPPAFSSFVPCSIYWFG